jgi:hypothetical protein
MTGQDADEIVQEYHAVMQQLWDLEWDANLDPEEELPDRLMPQYYIDYWNQCYDFKDEFRDLSRQFKEAEVRNDEKLMDKLVKRYHDTLQRFWILRRGNKVIPSDSELPEHLMPEYYIEYKRKIRR